MNELIKTYIDVDFLFDKLKKNNINFFTGVPDSLLKDFCAYVNDNTEKDKHVIASNEGNAVAIAAGYYFGTKEIPLVYLQNSGFGNIINPITSLLNESVYNIPMLILIGWRGQPGKKDEPQHLMMGKQMEKILESLQLEYSILPDYHEGVEMALNRAVDYMNCTSKPYVFLVQNHSFNKYKLIEQQNLDYVFSREEILHIIMKNITSNEILVSTTGMLSRELYEYRKQRNEPIKDILNVGSMGHCSSIGLGLSISNKDNNVLILDGDGSVLMHMGSMAINGCNGCKNFKHIIFNNGAHDSVGGQKTEGFNINFENIASGCNYNIITCNDYNSEEEIVTCLERLLKNDGPILLELRCKKGARTNLGRPENFKTMKEDFFNEWLK